MGKGREDQWRCEVGREGRQGLHQSQDQDQGRYQDKGLDQGRYEGKGKSQHLVKVHSPMLDQVPPRTAPTTTTRAR